jgi:hypothetical protein
MHITYFEWKKIIKRKHLTNLISLSKDMLNINYKVNQQCFLLNHHTKKGHTKWQIK